MLIKRYRPETDTYVQMVVPITEEQLQAWLMGAKTTDVMPNLSLEQRDFLLNQPPLRTML